MDREKQIREHAYHLWDRAGRPAHREDEFWHQAVEHVAHEEKKAAEHSKPEPEPAARKHGEANHGKAAPGSNGTAAAAEPRKNGRSAKASEPAPTPESPTAAKKNARSAKPTRSAKP